jgi:hypothetical protein
MQVEILYTKFSIFKSFIYQESQLILRVEVDAESMGMTRFRFSTAPGIS